MKLILTHVNQSIILIIIKKKKKKGVAKGHDASENVHEPNLERTWDLSMKLNNIKKKKKKKLSFHFGDNNNNIPIWDFKAIIIQYCKWRNLPKPPSPQTFCLTHQPSLPMSSSLTAAKPFLTLFFIKVFLVL